MTDMTDADIQQIIDIQLFDIDLQPNQTYHNIAINYYRQNGSMPDIAYVIDSAIMYQHDQHNQHMPHPDQDTESESDNSERDRSDDNDASIDSPNNNNGIGGHAQYVLQNIAYNPIIGTGHENIHPNIILNTQDLLNAILRSGTIPIGTAVNAPQFNIMPAQRQMVDVKKVIQDIESVPLVIYKSDNNLNINTECLMCYDKFVDTDTVRVLNCTHSFHRLCIDELLKKETHLCPYCKTPAGEYVYNNL